MRAFDNWNSYLNNDGNLLHGKIRFCRKGTTDNVAIYNRDGIALRNPEFTDMIGRTEYQVFVDNVENVTAYFYQYIGTGEMEVWPDDDYDPTRWAYQYSSDNMDPVNTVDLESTTAEGVATMADLRDKDPDEVPTVNGAKLLWLYGYYAAGDTSPVLYVWNPASLASDDGGSVIVPNSVSGHGRWILASKDYIFDVRHFGIFPQNNKYSIDYSYTSQLSNCATYLVNEGMNAWFPDYSNAIGYYLMDGSNTFSITGDIYVSDGVRFMCKTGTSGTAIQCHELHKAAPYLFDSTVQTGTATLTCDYVNISWVGGNCQGNARVGWVIDSADYPRVITGKEVKFKTNGNSGLQLNNCQISSNKQITGQILIQNSILKTEFFADDYDWSKLTSIGNTILLENCKDANTYILLKNKQGESDYGDLGEQSINADVRAGGTIENCYGTVRFISHGSTEMHNASLNVSGLTANDSLNLVDTWLTFSENTVLESLNLRRGSLSGIGAAVLQLLQPSLIDDADIRVTMTTLGAKLTVRNSRIYSYITAQDIDLINNDIYSEISQTDNDGVINVKCVGNMFHMSEGAMSVPARHYVHANTTNTKVKGIWSKNGSSYDTVHWIRLDRTNLLYSDWAHEYTYTGNSEPFLMKWSGRNHPMLFARFSGHWSSSRRGTGVFSEFALPFLFLNDREREISVVPKMNYWKMFTVGRGYMMRSGRIVSGTDLRIGILEGDYVDNTNGMVVPTWTWGCKRGANEQILDGKVFGYMHCVSRDADGEANYDVSFEAADATHGEYSYGTAIGYYPSRDWDSGSDHDAWPVYPATPYQATLFVFIDPDFSTGTNPMGWIPS